MPVEKILTYHLVRVLRVAIPVVVLVLIAVLSWSYWSRRTQPEAPQTVQDLPRDLAVLTEGFSFSRTEQGRVLFSVRAQTNLGFKDSRNMLENVEVIVNGDTDADPVRRIRSVYCDYDQQTGDIHFTRNVQVLLDERTEGRTEELTYSPRDRKIVSNQKIFLEQPGTMNATANSLEYAIDTSVLKLVGAVEVVTPQGTRLVTGSALLAEKDNKVTMTDGVLMESTNGTVRGSTGYADLEPGAFKPRTVVVEGEVTAESRAQNSQDRWNIRADRLEASLSINGNVERVEARGNAELLKTNTEAMQSLTGGEVHATLDATGRVDVVEARNNARMMMGSDRTLISNRIVATASGGVSTDAQSVLELGGSRIEGRQFTISQGDIVTFRTPNRAILQSGVRQSSADQTEARFDSRTNMFVELTQTGNFEFQEGTRSGRAQRAQLTDSGAVITLDGLAWIKDSQKHIDANQIVLDQRNNSFVATGNVKTVTKDTAEAVLVTAGRAEGNAEAVIYTSSVQLWRGPAWIRAQKLEASPKENRYHAEGSVQSMMNSVRANADKLDFDEQQRIAHYTGKVRAQKQNMFLDTDDMTVKAEGDEVSEIVALGNVVLKRADRLATGEKAVYNAKEEIVILTGRNARFVDGAEGMVEGPTLTVHTSGDIMTVQSDGAQRTTSKYKVKK